MISSLLMTGKIKFISQKIKLKICVIAIQESVLMVLSYSETNPVLISKWFITILMEAKAACAATAEDASQDLQKLLSE